MTLGLAVFVLLLSCGIAAAAALILRRRRLRGLKNDLELFALHKGLTLEPGTEAYIGRVKDLPLRVGLERKPSGSKHLVLSVKGLNPKGIAFVLNRRGLSGQANFQRAAPELVVALQRLRPGAFDELEVRATGETVWRRELWLPLGIHKNWLSDRLLECQEIARQVPKRRSIRSVSGKLEEPKDDEISSNDVPPPEMEQTDPDKTEPHAGDKLA